MRMPRRIQVRGELRPPTLGSPSTRRPPKRYARLLRQAHAAVLAADAPPVRLRELIRTSWQRALAAGVDPEHHRPSSAC
jgi:hypothetical protein